MSRLNPMQLLLRCLCVIFIVVIGINVYFSLQPLSVYISDETKPSNFLSAGIHRDGIPTITKPKFESVSSADQYLHNDGYGILIQDQGRSRFYPFQILVWHESVNDIFQGKQILIHYCPFCFSGSVFERTVQGEVLEFGTSEFIQENNILLYDNISKSLWNTSLEKSVDGLKNGTNLIRIPSNVVRWNLFKKNFPDGQVLSRNTGFVRDYTHDPYGDYQTNYKILFPLSHHDSRMKSKEMVFGVQVDSKFKAYKIQDIEHAKKILDSISQTPVAIEWNDDLQIPVSTFPNIKTIQTFWFDWVSSHPETDVYQLP